MKKSAIFKALIIAILIVISLSTITFADEENEVPEVTATSVGESATVKATENPILTDINADANALISEATKSDNGVIQNDVYEMQSSSELTKDVNGNVYIMAQDVRIKSKKIYGNVFIMAQDINIDGTEISGSVYLLGETIKFNGTCSEIYACGKKVSVEADSKIYRDVRLAGEKVNIKGKISRDAYIACDNLSLVEGAVIEGDLSYEAIEAGKIEGKVNGKVDYKKIEKNDNSNKVKTVGAIIFGVIWSTLSNIILSLIIMLLFYKAFKRDELSLVESTLLGLAFLAGVPILCLVLLLTVVGILPSILLFALYVLILCVAQLIALLMIADKLYKKDDEGEKSKLKLFLIDVALIIAYGAISVIPVAGGIVGFVLALMGCGIVLKSIFKK